MRSRQRLSDKICTALQLINFWQDVRRDILDRDRIYLPADDMQRFGVTEDQLREGRSHRRLPQTHPLPSRTHRKTLRLKASASAVARSRLP